MQSQNLIGWDQALKGRMSEQWQISFDKCKWSTKNVANKIDGLTWSIDTIHEMCQWFLKEWMDRNEKMHGTDAIAKAQKQRD